MPRPYLPGENPEKKKTVQFFTGPLNIGFGKRGLLEKGSFQKSPFSRDSRESRASRDPRAPPDSGKQRRILPFPRDSRENLEILEILEIPPVKRPLSQ